MKTISQLCYYEQMNVNTLLTKAIEFWINDKKANPNLQNDFNAITALLDDILERKHIATSTLLQI